MFRHKSQCGQPRGFDETEYTSSLNGSSVCCSPLGSIFSHAFYSFVALGDGFCTTRALSLSLSLSISFCTLNLSVKRQPGRVSRPAKCVIDPLAAD